MAAFVIKAVSSGTLKIGADANVVANDDYGTESTPAVATQVSVTAVNDAPTASENTLTIEEDTPSALTAADFGFSDVDSNDESTNEAIDAFVALETIDALPSGSTGSTNPSLNFMLGSSFGMSGGNENLLGLELASGGGGGQPIEVAEKVNENIDGKNPDENKPDENKSDGAEGDTNKRAQQAATVPTIPSEEPSESAFAESNAELKSLGLADLPEMIQAVDAVIDGFDEGEGTGGHGAKTLLVHRAFRPSVFTILGLCLAGLLASARRKR